MTREQFEHAIRAAGAVLGVTELLVIGSQALHASVDGALPPEAERSVKADVAAIRGDEDGRAADLIDGSIGEGSMFHDTFGYYVHGVHERTATLPVGWDTDSCASRLPERAASPHCVSNRMTCGSPRRLPDARRISTSVAR